MFKTIKTVLIGSVIFCSGCYSAEGDTFLKAIIQSVSDGKRPNEQLASVKDREGKYFADLYLRLYGENTLSGDGRRRVLNSIEDVKRKKLFGAVKHMARSLFFRAKRSVFDTTDLQEFIRLSKLITEDDSSVVDGINGLKNLLTAAEQELKDRQAISNSLIEARR